jgi:hypothetical protein
LLLFKDLNKITIQQKRMNKETLSATRQSLFVHSLLLDCYWMYYWMLLQDVLLDCCICKSNKTVGLTVSCCLLSLCLLTLVARCLLFCLIPNPQIKNSLVTPIGTVPMLLKSLLLPTIAKMWLSSCYYGCC